MGNRLRPAAGLALAVALSGVVIGLAPAVAGASSAGSQAAVEIAAIKKGAVEGPISSGAECSRRARQYTDSTGFFHFCRYKDGSDGFAVGWWVWLYN